MPSPNNKSESGFISVSMQLATDSLMNVIDNFTDNSDRAELAVIHLFASVIWADGKLSEAELIGIQNYLSTKYSFKKSDKIVTYLKNNNEVDIESAVYDLKELSENEKRSIFYSLVEIAFKDKYHEKEKAILEEIEKAFGFDDLLNELEELFKSNIKRRENLLTSSAGIIIALVIILIFILTATFLKSVLFGLILAYFFLPVQKWFYKYFFGNSVICKIIKFIGLLNRPFVKISQFGKKFCGKNPFNDKLTDKELAEKERLKRVNRSSYAAFFTVVIGLFVIGIIVFSISFTYVTGISSDIKKWTDKTVKQEINQTSSPDSSTEVVLAKGNEKVDKKKYVKSLFSALVRETEALKPKVEKIPGFLWAKNKLANYLTNENNQKALVSMILNKSGGVFSFTAGFVGNSFALALDLLLAMFFFSFFLQKMAVFHSEKERIEFPGKYMIDSIFSSKWMPHTSENAHKEACDILNNIFLKLQTWVKGYVSIILVESIIYIIAFLILGVPYAVIMGAVAGCTVLLPFIGPLVSGTLTILVCFAVGKSVSMLMILAIIIVYVIMNGVVEQLFLYPGLIGEALGLNTLETIIVVLLGGLFAGLAGMVFAVPAASVLKYLIPRIYSCWQR